MTTHKFIERKLHVAAGKKTTNTLNIFLIRMSSINESNKYSFSNDTRTKLRNSYGALFLISSELTNVGGNID